MSNANDVGMTDAAPMTTLPIATTTGNGKDAVVAGGSADDEKKTDLKQMLLCNPEQNGRRGGGLVMWYRLVPKFVTTARTLGTRVAHVNGTPDTAFSHTRAHVCVQVGRLRAGRERECAR